jgi:very-short-patch-repair endonuclease
MVAVVQESDLPGLVRKAVNLFTFLGRTQQLLVKPVRTVDKFEKALWLGDLPEHPAVHSAHRAANPDADSPLLAMGRVPKLDPPPVPDHLTVWVQGPTDDVDREPSLRDAIYKEDPVPVAVGGGTGAPEEDQLIERRRVELSEVPELGDAFGEWLTDWRLWADRERRDAAVRNIYKELFAIHLASTDHSEEFELVLGIGCLTWKPDEHEQVLRHVATAPIMIRLDENLGTLTVAQVPSPEAVSIELDMLDPALIPSPAKIDEIRQIAGEYEQHLLDQPAIGSICRRLIHRLDPDAEYDEEGLEPPTGTRPRGAFAPAIILRRRTNRGLVQIYQQIVSQIQESGEVPSGVLPLIDPDRQPESEPSSTPGAIVTIDEEDFLPLPVNDAQRRIIERVDRTAQTVVQGPPGTGKTHTAAALVSHLLAQGMRVLITAQTDRALQEVRAKLPREIQSLAVSVIGQSRSDMADLRTAVDNISRRADDFDTEESRKSIDQHLAKIDELRRHRAEAYKRLIAIRRQEVETRADGPENGTLAAIAYRHLEEEPQFEWIRAFDIDPGATGRSVSSSEIVQWHRALLDQDVISNEDEANRRLPELSKVVSPQDFAALVAAEQDAIADKRRFQSLLTDDSFEFVRSLASNVREVLRTRVSDLADRAMTLERRDEAWMNEALRDVRSGRQHIWLTRSAQVKSLAETAATLIDRIGPTTSVVVSGGDASIHQQVAKSLLAHLASGNKIKVLPDGSPKTGAFTSKTVKLAEPFFSAVKVNGVPAVTAEELGTFIDWVEATRTIAAMDQAWPTYVQSPDEETLGEKLHWHNTEVAQLDKVLELGDQLEVERAWFDQNKLPVPDWNNLDDIRRYAELVEAAAAADNAVTATSPIEDLVGFLQTEARWPKPPAVTGELLTTARARDAEAYASAHERLTHLHEVAQTISERNRIRADLDSSAPRLARAIAEDPSAPEWGGRISSYEDAWRWEMTGRWILAQDSEDANALKVRLNALEQQIRSEVEHLAAERAWGHAVAPGRLTGSARANLTQYAQLVSSLGKGTGKYAAKRRAEITEAMERCRPSVPVWIMPIYRIAEQVRVQPNLYDVVIVDEASQAGLEASFLQYLAAKIVVIGDDKQVSPSAVGVDQQQLRDLANMYLATDPYRASWLDPKRSYFDEANMRFGGRITLTEHRRCVPEIIGFSNRVAYEPEGIRLVPVRQFGAERLDPIKVVHLAEGYEADNKTNPVEADAIVDQIRKCLAEPQYDGATFGVISLLGKEQAKLIEHKLLDTVPPEEWSARELRCGDASDFQGSERNVMFLSMVKAPEADKRLTALTGTQYLQRFNVAASRAKDQMWVYHSMPREALINTEDMRYQLLDYCYGVVNRTHSDEDGLVLEVVPEDVLVPPFESLFEQRVFNRICDRGYTVVPQYRAQGYNIDMVIIGAKTRLAIECDGDFWHGPAEYEADLARQRELERCGWEFFRIRESVFYADMASSLKKLWETLDELDIRTADWIDSNFDDLASDEVVVAIDELPLDEPLTNVVDANGAIGALSTLLEEELAFTPPDATEASVAEIASPGAELDPRLDLLAEPSGGRHRAMEPSDAELADDEVRSVLDATSVEVGRHSAERLSEVTTPAQIQVPPGTHGANVIPAPADGTLGPYVAFNEVLPPLNQTTLDVMAANVVRIVAAEGPVLGHRVHNAYRDAYGGHRVGKEIARMLNRAIMLGERRGQIISDNPLNESGVKPRTYRLPRQPAVVPRHLGPRSLELVPPAELAHHLTDLSLGDDTQSEEELFRAVLDRLGLRRLTDNVRAVLGGALGLAAQGRDADSQS